MLAVIGMYLLSVNESFHIEMGDLLVLICAVFFAGHVVVISLLSSKIDPVKFAAGQFVVCSVFSFIGAFSLETMTFAGIWSGIVPILYGGLMSVGVAYTLQVVAQQELSRHTRQLSSALSQYLQHLPDGCCSANIDHTGLIGCGLMLCGMLLSQIKS